MAIKPLFKLKANYRPAGDQPSAIQAISQGFRKNKKHQTLLGVTGSGKTFTMAHVIAALQKPALVLAPNKTLAAQLFAEFKELFPSNAVEYFVSYYDYYQPEAYLPASDTYIEKDSSINDQIDRMRHSATSSLLERLDVVIVSSVSCIYGLGSPDVYKSLKIDLHWNQKLKKEDLIYALTGIQYERKDFDFHRSSFRVRGEAVEVFPSYEENTAFRIEFFGDYIHFIGRMDPLTGGITAELKKLSIYPVSHYVSEQDTNLQAAASIKKELKARLAVLHKEKKKQEHTRLKRRTLYDLEMIKEMGSCPGIENYSRHFTGRAPGEPPPTLLDYFPKDYLLFIDESHISVPQIGGMYLGDRSRKEVLVQHGFRLPSALDNRPLNFKEFEQTSPPILYVSATPGEYELKKSRGGVVEQIVRPTGLLDPQVLHRPVKNQVKDLLAEIKIRQKKHERVLVVTLTKKSAENLTAYYQEKGIQVRYLHSDIKTIERMELIRDLRMGVFQVLVGINLLREGLDLPEVSLTAVMDADKEGFLRSKRSLIQIMGRAARHINGKVILYADKKTQSILDAVSETNRRRRLQKKFNTQHHITPQSVKKPPPKGLMEIYGCEHNASLTAQKNLSPSLKGLSPGLKGHKTHLKGRGFNKAVRSLKKNMKKAADELDFEKAALLRDQIKRLQLLHLEVQD